jgi:hypothetical protein
VEVLGFEPNQDKTNRFTVCRASPSAPNLHEEIITQQKQDCKLFDSFLLSCYSIVSYKGIKKMKVKIKEMVAYPALSNHCGYDYEIHGYFEGNSDSVMENIKSMNFLLRPTIFYKGHIEIGYGYRECDIAYGDSNGRSNGVIKLPVCVKYTEELQLEDFLRIYFARYFCFDGNIIYEQRHPKWIKKSENIVLDFKNDQMLMSNLRKSY